MRYITAVVIVQHRMAIKPYIKWYAAYHFGFIFHILYTTRAFVTQWIQPNDQREAKIINGTTIVHDFRHFYLQGLNTLDLLKWLPVTTNILDSTNPKIQILYALLIVTSRSQHNKEI